MNRFLFGMLFSVRFRFCWLFIVMLMVSVMWFSRLCFLFRFVF